MRKGYLRRRLASLRAEQEGAKNGRALDYSGTAAGQGVQQADGLGETASRLCLALFLQQQSTGPVVAKIKKGVTRFTYVLGKSSTQSQILAARKGRLV